MARFRNADGYTIDTPNLAPDRYGALQRAKHAARMKEDPGYLRRWRIANALAKDKALAAAGGRGKVSLPRLAFLEKPETE